jgi:hypothetical protein
MHSKREQLKDVVLNFFPIQLLFLHLRKNLFGLSIWALLFAYVGGLSSKFGVPQLFLSPEYMGRVDNISFLIFGIGMGGFIAAYNLYSYVLLGPQIPFLGTCKRPLVVFSLNNFIIPAIFILFYLNKTYDFQRENELKEVYDVILEFVYLFIGIFIFLFFAFLYFFKTNKNIFKLSGKSQSDFESEFMANPVSTVLHREESWFQSFRKLRFQKHYYITEGFQIRIARYWKHYDKKLIEKVFYQNHVNTSIFELFIIASFVVFGMFGDMVYLVIPAGASIFLIFSILLMFISAVYSWFRSWTYLILASIFVLVNYLSKNPNFEQYVYPAFGLDYSIDKNQNFDSIVFEHLDQDRIEHEKKEYTKILENWKDNQDARKPKLILVNVSGGGSRSALWSFLVMRQLDSLTNGEFSNGVHMITGASGGMIGASYYRELLLRQAKNAQFDIYKQEYIDNISKELLNAVATAITTRDIFFKYKKFEYNGQRYLKDRGHAFELQLHRNTDFVLEKTLGAYEKDEREATIPVMVFSPTLINDGRRLLISSVETGFYQSAYKNKVADYYGSVEDMEYKILMRDFGYKNTRFSSVMRMSATFPYILPMVKLPGNLYYHVMDAGIRDNMGTKTTLKFLNAFENWIERNTSGVLIVRIRDVMRHNSTVGEKNYGISDKLFLPLGNMLKNFIYVQDFEQDDQLSLATRNYNVPVYVVSFDLRSRLDQEIALSFRLTSYEKKTVREMLNAERNQKSFYNVQRIIGKP